MADRPPLGNTSAGFYSKPGIYRRAFDWRISATDKESASKIAAAFATLSIDEWADIFEDYLRISRKRQKNRTAMSKLQLHLAEELVIAQAAIKHYRGKLNELKSESSLPHPNSTPDCAAKDLAIVEQELFFHRAHANRIRAIGDGIAWRALGYDRAALRALAGKAVKQQILEQGTINELYEWSSHFDKADGFAILNALTNWLAIGDVTVLDVTVLKDDGGVELVEVKSSGIDSNRVTRQKQKMREVTDLLKTGKGMLEGQNVAIMRLDILPENDLRALFELLEEADRCGWAARRITNWSYVDAIDFRAVRNFENVRSQAEERIRQETASWIEKDDLMLEMNSLDILAFTPNSAPFSVFPFPERLCVELLTGAKSYACHLNLTELGREFDRHGWQVEKSPEELMRDGADRETPMFRLRKDRMHPEIPPADIMRIQMETMRPSVIIQTLEAVLRAGPEGTSAQNVIVYDGEKQLWL